MPLLSFDAELLSAYWTIGSVIGQFVLGRHISERIERICLFISRQTTSTVPFIHGHYGSDKLWYILSFFQRIFMDIFWKWVPWSDFEEVRIPNKAARSMSTSVAHSASADLHDVIQT